ncbi:MAG: DUF6062 family protein [Bacillota bacterium]
MMGSQIDHEPKHCGLLELEVLEAFSKPGRCPVCELKQRASIAYVRWVVHEYANSPAFIEPFLESVGLCGPHWQLFFAEGDWLAISILAGAMVERAMEHVNNSMMSVRSPFGVLRRKHYARRVFSWAFRLKPCRVCQHESEAEERYVWATAHLMEEGTLGPSQVGGQLCLRHAVMVGCETQPGTALQMLQAVENLLTGFKGKCREAMDSFNYMHKGTGPDHDALHLIIEKVSLPGHGGQRGLGLMSR